MNVKESAGGCAGGFLIIALFALPSGIPAAITWFSTKSKEATIFIGVLAVLSLWVGFYILEKHQIFYYIKRDDGLKLLFFSLYAIGGYCYYLVYKDMNK